MDTIIQCFLEKVINLKEKSLEDLNNLNFLSDFTDNLNKNLMELGKDLVKNYLDELEKLIYESKERKEKYISYQKDSLANHRKLITIFGEIEYSRRYYVQKNDNSNKVYLLDKAIGLEENERMLVNVEEKMLEIATVKSYDFAGKNAAYDTEITKETVKNKIKELDFEKLPEEIFKEKKEVLRLYIQADEDHVALQKGGIAMPRLITIFEEKENGKLLGKKKFGGIYNGNIDKLWEEVLNYIENKYNYEKIKEIFIMGDGACWIKTGLEWLPKSKYISDRFHISKSIIAMTGNNKEYILKIREALFELDFDKVKELEYEILAEEMNKNKRKYKEEQLKYILNNEEGIRNSICYDIPGCSAEGDISHTYSDRLSSRPLGWSKENVDKMSRLRIMRENGINIKLLTRSVNNLNKKEEEKIKSQKEVSKMIYKDKYKRAEGICYTIPELRYGDYEMRNKLSEIIKCKAI